MPIIVEGVFDFVILNEFVWKFDAIGLFDTWILLIIQLIIL